MPATGTGNVAPVHGIVAMIFRQQGSGNIAFTATNMRVHVNRAGHHDFAF
jgi:hypothetical protein